jgi:hypothetical protein
MQQATLPRAAGSVSLSEPERARLAARIQRDGESTVLRALNVSRQTLGRLAGGLTVRRATATVALAFLREDANASG